MVQKRKKLLIIIWNLGLGGIQKRLRDILNDLSANYPNIQVTVIVKHRKPDTFLKTLKLKKHVQIEYVPLQNRRFSSITFALWITYKYLQISPDTVLTFLDHLSVQTIMMRKIFFWQKSRIVLNEGVVTSRYLQLNRGRFFWPYLVRKFYRFADTIIVPTTEVKSDLVTNFEVPKAIIKIIPNWTLHGPITSPIKQKYDLLFVGRFETEKDPLRFVNLVDQLVKTTPTIKTLMIGEGRLEDQIRTQIKKFNLSRTIEIKQPQPDPRKLYAQAKILVHTSQNEGFPNVILEAAVQKVPVVTINFKGFKQILTHKQNSLIASTNTELISHIQLILNDVQLYHRISQNAFDLITNKYSQRNQTHFIDTLLKETNTSG